MVNPLSTSVEDIPIDHTPIRITSAPPSKAFSGDSIESAVWLREIVSKAAINGLASVIKGSEPEPQPVLDKLNDAYNKVTNSRKSALLKEVLNIKQGDKPASTTITQYLNAYIYQTGKKSGFNLEDMKLFFAPLMSLKINRLLCELC
ncbi:hypothetical protein SeLEV6574_g07503 [Synchytrium endobioticum]|uniref:Uncharacterized protein n=1 Tax=Synchytrium endobioticum TaxID=286115 RepID=A0A507CBI1_9FUNG|nr:hypothetical protein SeLEV6574_g07503 [Synchytrium endobioticum]